MKQVHGLGIGVNRVYICTPSNRKHAIPPHPANLNAIPRLKCIAALCREAGENVAAAIVTGFFGRQLQAQLLGPRQVLQRVLAFVAGRRFPVRPRLHRRGYDPFLQPDSTRGCTGIH
jgi:hypothetical protein